MSTPTLERPSAPAVGWAVHDTSSLIWRSVRRSVRQLDTILLAVLLPVMLLLMFVYVFGGALQVSMDYVDFVVPGIILLTAGYGSANTAVDVASDMTGGIIDRFRSLPIRATGVLTGHVVASMVRNAVSTALVIGIAFVIGFQPVGVGARLGRRARPDRAVRAGAHVDRGGHRGRRVRAGGGQRVHVHHLVHPVRVVRVRAAGLDAVGVGGHRDLQPDHAAVGHAARTPAGPAGRVRRGPRPCSGVSGSSWWAGSRRACCFAGRADLATRSRSIRPVHPRGSTESWRWRGRAGGDRHDG